ncbi:MAG TPA: zinc metalloprotease HtpX [Actinomycetota bacterium]|nr:zinc metalloprotease HtpX [Actinomycetota bacterium]
MTVTPGINRAKTWVLIAGLLGLFLLVGYLIGGRAGMTVALVLGLVFNFAMYWWSGSIAVRSTRSREVSEQEYPQLYRIVRELTQAEGMPMPGIYVSDMQQPNAFATGRNPQNAKVAVTQGILQILDERELRGVLAHELSHVANRDILVASIAAAIGTSISYLAMMAFWFGGDDEGGGNPIVMLVAWILAPIAAGLIQMAVSRSREFQADESGAFLSRDPQSLASALQKLEQTSRRVPPPHSLQPGEAHLFIVNPLAALKGRGIMSLFRTHPPTEERVARLMAVQDEILRRQGPIGR